MIKNLPEKQCAPAGAVHVPLSWLSGQCPKQKQTMLLVVRVKHNNNKTEYACVLILYLSLCTVGFHICKHLIYKFTEIFTRIYLAKTDQPPSIASSLAAVNIEISRLCVSRLSVSIYLTSIFLSI